MLSWLLACSSQPPVVMSARYEGNPLPHTVSEPGHAKTKPALAQIACRVHFGEVHDLRDDTQSLGMIGGRPILTQDAAGWLASGLNAMGDEKSLHITQDGDADITLRADLMKAYIMTLQLAKSSTVVVAVHYGSDNRTQIYRGSDTAVNWASTADEAQASLNRALTDFLTQLRADLLDRCKAFRH